MRTIPATMIWETVQHGRWNLLSAFLGTLVLPLVLMFIFGRAECLEMGCHSAMVIHGIVILIDVMVLGAAIFTSQGSPSRLYVFPITTQTLVACHLFLAATAIAAGMLCSTILLNAVFGLNSPLWAPVLFAPAAFCLFLATIWLTEKSAWMPLASAFVTASLGYWYLKRFSPFYVTRFQQSDFSRAQDWAEITPVEILVLGVLTIVSYVVGVYSMSRNRHGEQIKPLGIAAWINRQMDFDSRLNRPFRSPDEAHFWFEWQKKGWCLPMIMIFGGLILCLVWVFDPRAREPRQTIEALIAGGALLSLAGAIVGMIIGNVGPIDTEYDMAQFLATRPMTSSNLARTILKVIGKSVLLTWTLWVSAFWGLLAVYALSGIELQPLWPTGFQWWYFPAMLISCWTMMGVFASLVLTGRTNSIAKVISILIVSFITLALITSWTLSAEVHTQLMKGLTFAIGIGFVFATGWLFLAAREQRLIGWPTVATGASIWTLLSAFVSVELLRHQQPSIPLYVFAVGVCALVVVPTAAAPLALSWNRTR